MRRLLFDEAGQVLEHTPPRPVDDGSASFVFEDLTRPLSSSERELASGEVEVPGLVLTLDGPAGGLQPATTRVPVASTAFADPGNYWLEAPDGVGELVEVESMAEDAYLVTRHPLIGSYEAGSTLRPLTLAAPVPDDVSAQERFVEADTPLRVVWRYRIDGRLEVAQAQVRIQRLVGLGDVAQADVVALVRNAWPDVVSRLAEASKLEGWVQVSTRWVSSQLRANGLEPSRFMMGERGADLVAARFVLHAAHNGEAPGSLSKGEFLELATAAWSQAWHDLAVGGKGLEVTEVDAKGAPKRSLTGGLTFEL